MIDDVRMALTALRAKGTPTPGQLSVVGLEGGLGAYLGIDESGRPHLLMEVDPREPLEVRAVAIAALEVGARELDGRWPDRDVSRCDVPVRVRRRGLRPLHRCGS